jgi:hypothetical protein
MYKAYSAQINDLALRHNFIILTHLQLQNPHLHLHLHFGDVFSFPRQRQLHRLHDFFKPGLGLRNREMRLGFYAAGPSQHCMTMFIQVERRPLPTAFSATVSRLSCTLYILATRVAA